MDFIEQSDKMGRVNNEYILAFDPGHTTGWALFNDRQIRDHGQINTEDIGDATRNVSALFMLWPEVKTVVIEDYRVYKWRAKHHVGSPMLTTRVIGCIETLCVQQQITNIIKQPAHIAKSFCTDKKLKDWGFYEKGQKHANDAIRHGAYYLLFGPIKHKDRQGATVG